MIDESTIISLWSHGAFFEALARRVTPVLCRDIVHFIIWKSLLVIILQSHLSKLSNSLRWWWCLINLPTIIGLRILRAFFKSLTWWVTPVLLRNVIYFRANDLLLRILYGHLCEFTNFLRWGRGIVIVLSLKSHHGIFSNALRWGINATSTISTCLTRLFWFTWLWSLWLRIEWCLTRHRSCTVILLNLCPLISRLWKRCPLTTSRFLVIILLSRLIYSDLIFTCRIFIKGLRNTKCGHILLLHLKIGDNLIQVWQYLLIIVYNWDRWLHYLCSPLHLA